MIGTDKCFNLEGLFSLLPVRHLQRMWFSGKVQRESVYRCSYCTVFYVCRGRRVDVIQSERTLFFMFDCSPCTLPLSEA